MRQQTVWAGKLILLGLTLLAPSLVRLFTDIAINNFWQAAPPLIWIFLYAPYAAWRHKHERVLALEEAAKTKLSTSTLVREFRKQGELVGCVRVSNDGLEQVKDCCAYLKRAALIKDGVQEPLDWAAYLRWAVNEGVGGGKYCSFQSEAVLDVVKIAKPYVGRATMCTVFVEQTWMKIPVEEGEYIFTIEFSAANSAPLTKQFRFTVDPRKHYAKKNGLGGFQDNPLPNLVFTQIL